MIEICYSSSLRDNGARRHVIRNASELVAATRGRNIIISSEAQHALELRGPYDVMNMSCLFGLDTSFAKQSVSSTCRAAIFRGASRKTGKTVFEIQPLNTVDDLEKWKVNEPTPKETSDTSKEPPDMSIETSDTPKEEKKTIFHTKGRKKTICHTKGKQTHHKKKKKTSNLIFLLSLAFKFSQLLPKNDFCPKIKK